MDNLEDIKKKFLDGKISALEYEKLVTDLSNKQQKEQIKETIPVQNVQDNSYVGVIIIIIVISLFILYLVSSNSKPDKEILSSNITPTKTKSQIATEDSLYKIELEKRRKDEIAEEAAFLKTKAGKIYKKHPEWSKRDCERLADGSIWIGMHINMLKYRMGKPNSANPSNYGNGVTQWQWCWSDWTPSCYYDNDDDGLIDSYN